MNFYFLVEGRRTEKKVYPKLLSYLLPQLSKVEFADEVIENHYYLISGEGYHQICGTFLETAIKEVNEHGNYQYLIVVVDTDNEDEPKRIDAIRQSVKEKETILNSSCNLHIVTQVPCIETWFLGNREAYLNPQSNEFFSHAKFYDVSQKDPELMSKPNEFVGTISNYHESYLKKMVRYSKEHPGKVTTGDYLDELQKRIDETSHLSSLKNFLNFCASI